MERHPFAASDLRGLVKSLQKPIAIFKYSKDNNLIVDVMHGGKHFLVGVTFDYKAGGIEVNSVSGLFPKDSHEWIKWIQEGKAIRIDQKKKVLDLIDSLRTNPAESERIGLNLSSAAKIINGNGTLKWVDKKKGLAYLSSASHYVQQEIDKQNLSSASKIINGFENAVIKDENLLREGEGAYTDDELSLMNDPVAKMFGKSQRTRKQRAAFAARERENMEATVRDLAEKLHLSNVEINTSGEAGNTRMARAKGYFNKKTGKIVINVRNHRDAEDAKKTLLHEGVAHYGQRKFLGDKFDGMLDRVYANIGKVGKARIDAAVKNGDIRTATEEYLAGMAEDMNFDEAVSNYHRRLRETLVDMYASVEDLMQSIAKATGKPVKSFENVMRSLNQQTSKGSEMEREWTNRIWVPLSDCIRGIVSDTDMSFDDVNRYVMLKHGLERNRKYALRDARKYYDEWLIRTIVS